MSTIIDDYLFRCPSWKLASQLTEQRASYFAQNTSASSTSNSTNVYVYRFSQPTHVAGYPECWGLACHTAEMPYIFNSIPIIMEEVRSNDKIQHLLILTRSPTLLVLRAWLERS